MSARETKACVQVFHLGEGILRNTSGRQEERKQEGEKADPQCAQLELDRLGQVPVQLHRRGSEPERPKRRVSNDSVSHFLSRHMGCLLACPGLHVSSNGEPVAQASHSAQDRSPRGETEATGRCSQGICE